jgi:trehalose-6-phosphate synthase
MNLVAKEYCACRIDEDGVLILRPVRCGAEQLKPDALLVNPYDVEQMADTILQAFQMGQAQRSARMRRMRRVVRNENVFWWVDSFLKAGARLGARTSRAFEKRSIRLRPRYGGQGATLQNENASHGNHR